MSYFTDWSVIMKKQLVAFALAFALSLSAVFLCGAAEFTADLVDVEEELVVQKMYIADQKMRFDAYDDEDENAASISILRLDTGVFYIITPETNTYMEIPVDKSVTNLDEFNKTMMPEGSVITRESMGKEKIGEYEAEKFKVTSTMNMMGQEITMTNYEWVAPEFAPMPVRIQDSEDDSIAEMRNIKVGPVDASLFEVPAGYQRDTEMEEMMKSMSQ